MELYEEDCCSEGMLRIMSELPEKKKGGTKFYSTRSLENKINCTKERLKD